MKQLDNIKAKAEALNQYLLNNEVIKEYQQYEKLIKNNKKLQALEREIKQLQKQIVNQKSKQDGSVTKTIEIYNVKKETFEKHPLVVNYLYLRQEVDMILQYINTRINGELSKQVLTK